MSSDAKTTVQPQGEVPGPVDRTVALLNIQPRDLRPGILRRWAATVVVDDPSVGACYWRAVSREKLLAKAVRELQRTALSRGIKNPILVVNDPYGHPQDDSAVPKAARVEAGCEVEVVAAGAI